MGDDNTATTFVMLFFSALWGAWYLAFRRNRDWEWKERWHVPAVAVTTVVAVVAALVVRSPGLLLTVGLGVVFLRRNIRNTRFCHRCGRTNCLRGNPRPRLCRECGLDLQAQA